MPTLTFPIQPAGLVCDVLVGLDGRTTTALHATGQAILAPVRCRGLIDSGTDVTSVTPAVLRQLGLNHPIAHTRTNTLTGAICVDLFKVSLSVTDFGSSSAPMLVLPTLQVMELPAVLSDLDVLIGMDVLVTVRLLVDGPGRFFTLEF